MAHADDIIVLDDDDDDEKPHCSTAKKPSESPAPQTNGRKGGGESQNKGQCMSAENKKLFEEFVDYCSGLTEDHPEVIPFLKGRLANANQTYLSSVEFRNVLGRCLTRVQSKRSKIYVYINELCTSLKANSQKRKLTLKPSTKSTPSVKQVEEVKEENEEKEEEEPVKKTGSKRQIRYLENLLRIYSREIQKLQERELTLDDLEEEDSAYIQEARLKRKILLIFQKLCELKDCPSLTGRVIEQRIPYRGTRYPEVNRRLEKFINESRDGFPDYGDVLRVIERACDRHELGLPRRKIQGMAQDAFREIGNLLQERRHLDMVYNFGCHLTDSYKAGTDPAQQDPSLSRRLRENRGMALARLDEVIKLYAEKQDEDEGEDEKRRKRKKDTETASTSKAGKVSPVQSRNTPTPPSQNSEDDEESVEESETDIEEELKQAEEVSEGEEDEEATEVPNNEENDGDQRMEIPSTPPNLPVEEANDEEEGDDLNEDNDEQMEDISQPVTPLSDEEEDSINIQETESNIQESPTCSATQINKPHPCSTTADNGEKENHEEAINTSEVETVEDCKKDVIVDNGDTHEESDMPYSENKTLIAKESDIKSDLPSSTDSSVVEEVLADGALPHEESHLDTPADPAHTGDTQSSSDNTESLLVGDDEESTNHVNKQTTDLKEEEGLNANSSTHTNSDILLDESSCEGTHVDNDTPPVESSSRETEVLHIESNTEEHSTIGGAKGSSVSSTREGESKTKMNCKGSNTDLDTGVSCVESSLRDDSEDSRGSSLISSGDSSIKEEVSHMGSSNGLLSVPIAKQRGKDLLCVGSSTDSHMRVQRGTTDIIKKRKLSFTNRKRKWSSERTLLENGDRAFNGKKHDRRAKIFKRSINRSPDKDPSQDLSLEMIVSCSPPTSRTSQNKKTNASTQCDPEEVIVLSD
ncbi:death domain-associated protein 6 [Bombina bombina]|uniref:death domain-associated protein 6 n=1 Tax=Bombina bombina TaxID=8345 RepID=UPI00235AB2A4|nr:death domain-associated protein 6 [Bombina bombina]